MLFVRGEGGVEIGSFSIDRDPCSLFKNKLYFILFYLITLEGLRGTTYEFATIPFHLVLFQLP